MMEFKDVGGDGQERPFRRNPWGSPAQETATIQILLGEGEGAFGLNGAVDAQQHTFRSIDLRLHGLPPGGEAPGDLYDLTVLFQRLF